MHEKWFKIAFFANFRKLQKKLLICKKKYTKILHAARAVVTNVEKKVKSNNRIFFGSAKVAPDCRSVVLEKNFDISCDPLTRRILAISTQNALILTDFSKIYLNLC